MSFLSENRSNDFAIRSKANKVTEL